MGTVSIDVIKLRTSQNKDGDTLTVRLNPADETARDAILLARPGSQFRMTLNDLDDDGNPPDAGAVSSPARGAGPQTQDKPAAPASRLTQMACIACNDPVFWRYLDELGYIVRNRDHARKAVYELCDVDSRKEFIVATPAGDRWLKFYDKFALWRSGHPF